MKKELNNKQLATIGFKDNQTLQWGEGRIGINNVVGFTNESKESPVHLIPARFLAGFIPTLLLAETIACESHIKPTVRVFFPENIAEKVNGIHRQKIDTQMHISKKLLSALQRVCFPQVFLTFSSDQPLTAPANTTLQNFFEIINKTGDKEVVQSIEVSAQRHGNHQGKDNSSMYIAHHIFGWQEVEAREIFNEGLPDIVINTLPPSEKRFLQLRRSIRSLLRQSSGWKTPGDIHDLEMNIAGAHYLLVDPAEPTIQEAFMHPVKDIMQKFRELQKRTGNDNIRKAKNDFERLIFLIAERTNQTRDEASQKTLGELLGVSI